VNWEMVPQILNFASGAIRKVRDGRRATNHHKLAAQTAEWQAESSRSQASLNRKLGEFNASIAMRVGAGRARSTALMTRALIAEQRVTFASRGITSEGSPMLVMGETYSMGSRKVQEEWFNANVHAFQAHNAADAAVAQNLAMASNAVAQAGQQNVQAGGALRDTIGLAKQIAMQGFNTFGAKDEHGNLKDTKWRDVTAAGFNIFETFF